MAITGRAAGLAFALTLVVLVAPAPWAALGVADGLLVVAILVDLALAGSVRALSFARSGPGAARLGEPVPMVLSVTNGGQRTARVRIRDAWPPSARVSPRVATATVPAGERRRVEQLLRPTRRGDRRPFRVTVRCIGPLGLAGRQGRHAVDWRLRVLPPFSSRRHLPAALARLREIEGEVAVRGRGQGSEFDSLREYVTGDDARTIDWRATARRGTVTVRTYRPERDRQVICVLDTGRTSAGRVRDGTRLDHYLDATLLLAAVATRAGDRVGLLAHDAVVRLTLPPGSAGSTSGGTSGAAGRGTLARLTEAMATLEPALLEADHRAGVAAILRSTRRRSLVVLFTELVPAVVEEGLIPALPAVVSRHTVVVAALRDPRLAELAAGRDDARAVYAAAAAERTLGERRRLSALLRHHGVEVVDAGPDAFAPAVTDTYLTLKAAGRL
ncbi:MAG: DUF58 domain-containing protein [Frankia sp.]